MFRDPTDPSADELAAIAAADAERRHNASGHPRTVLVLGGGGMKGFAHIGVMRALERLGIQVDEVIGTSMGAVMGSLWASGLDSERVEEVAQEIDIRDYLRLNLVKFLIRGYRHASVYKGKVFHDFLREHLPQQDFRELERPFLCNALSLTDGSMRYFGLPGDSVVPVADAVYASACLPGVFEPLMLGDNAYIDGGMGEALALKLAHTRRPDLVIAVDLSIQDHHDRVEYKATLPHILFQTYSILGQVLQEHNLHRYADEKVVLIKPKVSHFGVLSQPDTTELVRIGEREALEVLTTHPRSRWLCEPEVVREIDRSVLTPKDYVQIDVDMGACIHCGVCATTCATNGYIDVPSGSPVRKVHHYECTRDLACERSCPTRAITLRNV